MLGKLIRALLLHDWIKLEKYCKSSTRDELCELIGHVVTEEDKIAFKIVQDHGCDANTANSHGWRPLDTLYNELYPPDVDGHEIFVHGSQWLLERGADPYLCQTNFQPWLYDRFNARFESSVKKAVFYSIWCLTPIVGRDVARKIGFMIWEDIQDWKRWKNSAEGQRTLLHYYEKRRRVK